MNDTREQLERSIDRFLGSWTGWSVSIKVLREAIIGWLDRQAAITEREYMERSGISELQERVNQLEAELTAREHYPDGFVPHVEMVERVGRLEFENAELKSKLNYLEGHGVEIVDAVAGGYEVYNEWYRKAQELEEAMAMDSRIRAQQSNCIDNLAKRRDELLDEANMERAKCSLLQTEARKLMAERDALADDLAECMEERDYWKQQVQFCMDAAYPPSHAPERPYDPRVMVYPTPDECTTPSTLVSEVIDGLRDDVRDMVMPIVEESANAKADCERWREACGSMLDVAHEIERIMREFEEK